MSNQMTFLHELKRLMDARALGGFSGVDAENELQGYLLNHAPALAELVEIAQAVKRYPLLRSHIGSQLDDKFEEALAKLNANDVNDGGKHEG